MCSIRFIAKIVIPQLLIEFYDEQWVSVKGLKGEQVSEFPPAGIVHCLTTEKS